jgi:hypothetical protein
MVSHPGVDNTIEAILMGAIAGVQVLLFALGAAGVDPPRQLSRKLLSTLDRLGCLSFRNAFASI